MNTLRLWRLVYLEAFEHPIMDMLAPQRDPLPITIPPLIKSVALVLFFVGGVTVVEWIRFQLFIRTAPAREYQLFSSDLLWIVVWVYFASLYVLYYGGAFVVVLWFAVHEIVTLRRTFSLNRQFASTGVRELVAVTTSGTALLLKGAAAAALRCAARTVPLT